MLTGNVTIDEGIRILRHMDVETKDATREDLFAAASELSRENVDARQPLSQRRTLDDIVPAAGLGATALALRNTTLRDSSWHTLADILRGVNAEFTTDTVKTTSGNTCKVLRFKDASFVLNCIRAKATQEPISVQDLQDSGIGKLISKYAQLVPFPWVKKQVKDLVCLLKAQVSIRAKATPGAVDHAAPGDASGVCDQCETCTTSFQKFCSECGQPPKQRARVACSTPAPQAAGMLGG